MGRSALGTVEEKTNEANLEVRLRTMSRKEAGLSLLESNINQGAEMGAHLSAWMEGSQGGEKEGGKEGWKERREEGKEREGECRQ